MTSHITIRSALFTALTAALLLPAAPLSAQDDADDPGVVVLNESMETIRVYAYQDDVDDRELLGWVGSEELEFFKVPEGAKSNEGEYHVAIQQVTPFPQLGVPATAHPLLSTEQISPEPYETLQLIVDEEMEMTTAVIR